MAYTKLPALKGDSNLLLWKRKKYKYFYNFPLVTSQLGLLAWSPPREGMPSNLCWPFSFERTIFGEGRQRSWFRIVLLPFVLLSLHMSVARQDAGHMNILVGGVLCQHSRIIDHPHIPTRVFCAHFVLTHVHPRKLSSLSPISKLLQAKHA
jgi:hypothetical protein